MAGVFDQMPPVIVFVEIASAMVSRD